MTTLALNNACHSFAKTVSPYLQIKDKKRHAEALDLIESLLEDSHDSPEDPLNAIIDMLAFAIETYENNDNDEEVSRFEAHALEQPSDLAMLRVLMDQHHLGVADLPEIGSKSMVSRVLSGKRQLSKNHISALSQRFQVDPALFF